MERVLRCLWITLLALAAVSTPDAHAKGGGKDGKKKGNGENAAAEERPREKTAEQKELEAIGKEFKDKDVDALVARIPEKGKIRISMGDDDDRFSRAQARGVIEGWFETRTIIEVKLKDSDKPESLRGAFRLKLRRKGKTKSAVRELVIEMKRDGTKFTIHVIRVQSQ